jgi:ELWxxDGT repeat protein
MKTSLLKKLFANIIALLTGFICIVHTTNGQVFKLVKDIVPGATGSNPVNLVNVNGILYFSAFSASNGSAGGSAPGLFKSDGTAAGTVLIKVIGAGYTLSFFTNVNGALFFTASHRVGSGLSPSARQLWKSDGTKKGTVTIYPSTLSPLYILGNVNGTLYFVCGKGLYKSDGTVAGTVLVKSFYGAVSYDPGSYANINGTLYFSAIDSAHGDELWKSDGTAAGTVLIKDIYPGGGSSDPSNFMNVNGELYFSAGDSAHGIELWKSNGTAAGTILVKDIYPGVTGSSNPQYLTNVNGTLYFFATDSAHGGELWKSDGTTAGTVLVKDIYAGINSSVSYPNTLTNVNGTLYFNASDATHGSELYKSDGTSAGTLLVKDIYPGVTGSYPQDLTNVNGTLYFQATDAAHGSELWKSDGTAAGTVLVQDFEPGTGSSNPGNITVINSITFLTAATTQYGAELYSGSTPAGGPLPLTFINFDRVLKNNEVELKWTTANEMNSKGFEVEKSTDSKNFFAIGFIKSKGNTTAETDYDFKDAAVQEGINYYRLKQTDNDGNFKYSSIIKVAYTNINANTIIIAPNPFSNSSTISFTLSTSQKVSIQIFDIEGRLIKTLANEQMPAGVHQITWNATNENGSAVANGMYYLKLNVGNYTETKKLSVIK